MSPIKFFVNTFVIFILLFIINEFLIYYWTLYLWCKWPSVIEKKSTTSSSSDVNHRNDNEKPLRAMILSDTHLIGPFKGHWFDKLRREWQMYRSFQTAITLFNPEVVFILGDLFDEGEWVNQDKFNEYVDRYNAIFKTPEGTVVYGIVGNHDVGFHYKLRKHVLNRFKLEYKHTEAITIRGINFIRINSMAMEADGCVFCNEAEIQLKLLSKKFKCTSVNNRNCSRPIILQHFPTYRESDVNCMETDSTQPTEVYRENWEVLSKQSTKQLGVLLKPRLMFSGHSHHYCRINNSLNIEEYTLASFNWRNINNPSFVLTEFVRDDYAVSLCRMPRESTVICIYIFGLIFLSLGIFKFNKYKLYYCRNTGQLIEFIRKYL